MKRILIDNKQEDLKQIAYSIPWKSDTVCLRQICICNSHVESIQPITNLIKNKKEKQAESKENILEEQVSKEPKVIGIKKK